MARSENKGPRKELNETHQKAEDARGKGGTGRDSRFGLARPVLRRKPRWWADIASRFGRDAAKRVRRGSIRWSH